MLRRGAVARRLSEGSSLRPSAPKFRRPALQNFAAVDIWLMEGSWRPASSRTGPRTTASGSGGTARCGGTTSSSSSRPAGRRAGAARRPGGPAAPSLPRARRRGPLCRRGWRAIAEDA